jgi:two-component system, OmpR family, response regulator
MIADTATASRASGAPKTTPNTSHRSMRVLVIEDDPEVGRYLVKGLKESGYVADHAATGTDGLVMAMGETYDAMIIDRMLPGVDGLALIETLRKSGNRTPVMILSALGDVDQRVQGLRAGSDDYLTKPFAFTELLARLEALLRRGSGGGRETVLRAADLDMDLLAHTVHRGGKEIDLQPREFRLLEFLMRHAGHVVTRTMLLEGVWDYHFDPQTNVIDVHISRLRQKIDKGFDRPLIHTIRGAGYSLRVGESRTEDSAGAAAPGPSRTTSG